MEDSPFDYHIDDAGEDEDENDMKGKKSMLSHAYSSEEEHFMNESSDEADELEDDAMYDGQRRRRKRKSRQQLQHDRIYGIWADVQDEEEDPGDEDEGGGRRLAKRRSRVGAGMAFVSEQTPVSVSVSTLNRVELEGKEEEMKEIVVEDEGNQNKEKIDELLRQGGTSDRKLLKSNKDFALMIKEEQEKEEKKKIEDNKKEVKGFVPHRPDTLSKEKIESMGTWEKHTKGFGMKMLQKMGFKGRLGKEERGIASSIAVKVRPNQMGLGFGNFREASALKENVKIEEELHGIKPNEKNKHGKDLVKSGELADEGLWRKRSGTAKKKIKRTIKTASEVLSVKEKQKEIIVDMRGPKTKVLSDISEMNQEIDVSLLDLEKPKYGQELLYNIRLIVQLGESKICDLDRRIKAYEDKEKTILEDIKVIGSRVGNAKSRLRGIDGILAAIEKMKTRMETSLDGDFENVLEVFMDMKANHPKEFHAYRLSQLIPALAMPSFKKMVDQWSPLQGENNVILRQLSILQDALFMLESATPSSPLSTAMLGQKTQLYEKIVEDVLVARIRRSLTQEWNVRKPDECVALMTQLVDFVPPRLYQGLLDQIVLPRLQRECESWNPVTDALPIHTWITPWISLVQNRSFSSSTSTSSSSTSSSSTSSSTLSFSALFPPIRQKMSGALTRWHPSDDSASKVISPWKNVWDEGAYDAFVRRSVVPKLVDVLRNELCIDPTKQDLRPMKWVLDWHGILPTSHMVALLSGELFPKWLTVLHAWLSQTSPSFYEIVHWYQGWKALFPKALLNEPDIVARFNQGLYMMDIIVSNEFLGSKVFVETSFFEVFTMLEKKKEKEKKEKRLEDERVQSKQETTQDDRPKSPAVRSEGSFHFKDVVENFAAENGVVFVPNYKRGLHEGKQVYLFNKLSIKIDQGVVFMEDSKGSGSFVPVSLETLLQRAV